MILCRAFISAPSFKLLLGRTERGRFEFILGLILPEKKTEAITIIEGPPFVRYCARPFPLGVIDFIAPRCTGKEADSKGLSCPEYRAQTTAPRAEFEAMPLQHT